MDDDVVTAETGGDGDTEVAIDDDSEDHSLLDVSLSQFMKETTPQRY